MYSTFSDAAERLRVTNAVNGEANPSSTNNRRDKLAYDAAGNLTNDELSDFGYDATGQQTTATSATGAVMQQGYDGDGLRVKRVESGTATYYVRSSVLGGQVIAEVSTEAKGAGVWERGYVYLGGQLLAIQQNGVKWVHQDPVVKSQRLTDAAGH